MEIKSNTIGKLQKIRKGTVFTQSFAFSDEFVQNCQRSLAKDLNITIDESGISFVDNGCGCKNPENLLTLDMSSWDSTQEGFGIGFWSCIAVPELSKVKIKSKNWKALIDIDAIFNEENLDVELDSNESSIDGFQVTLESPYFYQHKDELAQYISNNTRYIKDMNITINGETVEKKDMFSEYRTDCYYKIYDNRLFKAKIIIGEPRQKMVAYYDKRKVGEIYDFCDVCGVIEFKTDKITLKEPDRTSIIEDDKYRAYRRKFRECIVDVCKSYISEYGINNEDYVDCIAYYLSTKDYERYLDIDICDTVLPKTSKRGSTVVDDEDTPEENNSAVVQSNKSNIITSISRGVDVASHSEADEIRTGTIRMAHIPEKKIQKKTMSQMMPKLKRCVWVEINEIDYYKDMLANAEYCGIKIIKAKNRLYRYALQGRGILHISSLNDALTKTTIKTDICLKTNKEVVFVQLLNPICEKYNLPFDTFKIANLSTKTEFAVDGNVYYKDVKKNKKGNIQTFGVTDGRYIYLDRTGISLSSFAIKQDNFGVHEIKALMHYINTIAHEMSHLLYHTTDNTVEHYEHQERLIDELMELYLK